MPDGVRTSTLVQFRAGQLYGSFNTREGSPGVIAKRDLERYYFVLRQALRDASLKFPEALLLMEVFKDIPMTLPTVKFASAIILEQLREADSFTTGYEEIYRIIEYVLNIRSEAERFSAQYSKPSIKEEFSYNTEIFKRKIEGLSLIQIMAIWDAAENWTPLNFLDEVDVEMSLSINHVWDSRAGELAAFLQWSPTIKELNAYLEKRLKNTSTATPDSSKGKE